MRGSTSGTTDSAGTLTSTISYFSFGAICSSTGSSPTDKKFTGQILDNTGLYYYNARYYDPGIGRFISADTIVPNFTNPQSLNRYSYCLNNPLKYIDPSGFDPVDSLGGIGYYYSLCEENGIDPDAGLVFVLGDDGSVNEAIFRNAFICWTGQYSYIQNPIVDLYYYFTNQDLYFAVKELNKKSDPALVDLEMFQLVSGLCGPIGPISKAGAINKAQNISKAKSLISEEEIILNELKTGTKGKISEFPENIKDPGHQIKNILSRDGHGVNSQSIIDAVNNPLNVSPGNTPGTTVFTGQNAVVVLNQNGGLVTTYPTNHLGWRW